jgi:tetratricopeptide (TPR) repeat protein
MNACHAAMLLIVGCLLTAPTSVHAQNSDWDRFIAAGDAAMAQKQYSQAEEAYLQALKFAESHWKKDARISGALIKLAESCNAQGKRDEAEILTHRSVTTLPEARKTNKPNDASNEFLQMEVAMATIDKAGDIFAVNQKYPEAEKAYLQAIAIGEAYVSEKPPSHPTDEDFFRFMAQSLGDAQSKLVDAYDKLGHLYLIQKEYEDAARQYQKSEVAREKQFGPDKPQVAQSLSDVAMCYALQAKYDQAEPLYKQVIAILERNNLQEKPEMAAALENYSLILRKTGRDAEAAPVSERARAIRTKLSETTH